MGPAEGTKRLWKKGEDEQLQGAELRLQGLGWVCQSRQEHPARHQESYCRPNLKSTFKNAIAQTGLQILRSWSLLILWEASVKIFQEYLRGKKKISGTSGV